MQALTRARTFLDEVVDEIRKVTWPDKDQLRNATFVIIVFVIVVALIIWVMDLVVRFAVNGILNLFTG